MKLNFFMFFFFFFEKPLKDFLFYSPILALSLVSVLTKTHKGKLYVSFSQPFFENLNKTLKFQEKSKTVRKECLRKMRISVGNALSGDLGLKFQEFFLFL